MNVCQTMAVYAAAEMHDSYSPLWNALYLSNAEQHQKVLSVASDVLGVAWRTEGLFAAMIGNRDRKNAWIHYMTNRDWEDAASKWNNL